MIALQSFAVFCQTSAWISHRCTYIPSLLNLPPISLPIPLLQVDTENLFEFPETKSKFPLAVYFTYGKQCQTLFFGAPKLQMVTAAMKLKDAYSLEGKLWPT